MFISYQLQKMMDPNINKLTLFGSENDRMNDQQVILNRNDIDGRNLRIGQIINKREFDKLADPQTITSTNRVGRISNITNDGRIYVDPSAVDRNRKTVRRYPVYETLPANADSFAKGGRSKTIKKRIKRNKRKSITKKAIRKHKKITKKIYYK